MLTTQQSLCWKNSRKGLLLRKRVKLKTTQQIWQHEFSFSSGRPFHLCGHRQFNASGVSLTTHHFYNFFGCILSHFGNGIHRTRTNIQNYFLTLCCPCSNLYISFCNGSFQFGLDSFFLFWFLLQFAGPRLEHLPKLSHALPRQIQP